MAHSRKLHQSPTAEVRALKPWTRSPGHFMGPKQAPLCILKKKGWPVPNWALWLRESPGCVRPRSADSPVVLMSGRGRTGTAHVRDGLQLLLLSRTLVLC